MGYVGLPLAVAFARPFDTVGYEVSAAKVESYRSGCDPAGEVSRGEFEAAKRLSCTNDPSRLSEAEFIIVAVPASGIVCSSMGSGR